MDHSIRKIDLHMHSIFSDGTDSMPVLLEKIRGEGIDLFSVTDHDAVKAGMEMPLLLQPGDPSFITGVEISCRDEGGKYHILGYGYDPTHGAVAELVGETHRNRMAKFQARIDYLRDEYGFVFTEEEMSWLHSLDNPGKPHIAKLMIRHGYVKTVADAIRDYIDKLHFKSLRIAPERAIRAILEAGGIPVLAHPFYGSGDELIVGPEMEERLQRLVDFGIQGVEAFYSGFTPKLEREMLRLADQYGLYVTAGSDYHGTNKIVELGDNNLPEDPADWPEGLRRFLGAVKCGD